MEDQVLLDQLDGDGDEDQVLADKDGDGEDFNLEQIFSLVCWAGGSFVFSPFSL